jgi:hypothetical protein|nr:AtzH-like domain-containing protein [Elioraea sp. Yellowstone]
MEIDIPEAVAEARAVLDRDETALMSNDIPALEALLWDDPRTIRFGVARSWRTGRRSAASAAHGPAAASGGNGWRC